jgi:hypothetical protein
MGPIIVLMVSLTVLVSLALAAEPTVGMLVATDAVTAPGRPVKLEARLVRSGTIVETALGGEQVDFIVAGKKVGTAMTGGDGRAYLEYRPTMRGNQTVTVRLVPNKRVQAGEATAVVAAWERRRPLLLVERAALVGERSKSPLPDVGLLMPSGPAPASGATEELKRLTEFYFNVIYVERTDEKAPGPRDFREWLKQHEFPFGLRITVKDYDQHLHEALAQLRADGWENLQAGVARSQDFGEALLKHRLRTILLAEEHEKALPRRIEYARDWREARKLLQR